MTPYYEHGMVSVYYGDALTVLQTLPDESVQCCVTSPPYWGLRDYGNARQIGLEKTPAEYAEKMVSVFREVRRVLRKDGTCWLNLGDSYAAGGNDSGSRPDDLTEKQRSNSGCRYERRIAPNGLKPKDLVGIPWMVAKALRSPYYNGKITREIDRVWLAAMIDAEGTICGFTHERKDNGDIRNGIHVTITNSNTAILDKCFDIWPTTREEHNVHSAGHLGDLPTWRWIVHGIEQKALLLRELYPYFVGKKKQAMLAWNFLDISRTTRGRNKGDEGKENRERYNWIVGALSKLNHLEQVDIPSWCKEPPSLYEDGWWLRSDIIWAKPNPMPESVTDRPTKSHEYLFLLTKSATYYYDADAIAEPSTYPNDDRKSRARVDQKRTPTNVIAGVRPGSATYATRNARSVWTITTQPYPDAHFATFPPKLIQPCILAGSMAGDTVLDPFHGAGTTAMVSKQLNRRYVGIELNREYIDLSAKRLSQDVLAL